ncbi:MAG: putative DNA binding domain-containing protein [Prevotella sp.]|jgi:predicted HTH transcriptional regulator|nr:putative DNA binding domain-containing protein [Prevotella sp.]
MEISDLKRLVDSATNMQKETEWIEFKHNFHSVEEIGERISAISNSACILNKPCGYLIFGIEDETHEIVGTSFKAKSYKKGNEELELWLVNRLNPRIDFETYEFDYSENIHISIYIIPATITVPVTFLHTAYIRVGSLTKKLEGYSDKEAKIWRKGEMFSLDSRIVRKVGNASEILSLLSTETYFDLLHLPYPQNTQGIIERLISEHIVKKEQQGYSITELGAILFAKNLFDFDNLSRKAIRVIVYKGKNKIETVREQIGTKGYAVGFEGLVDWIDGQLPANEEIGRALRKEVRIFPKISLRELIANALIHQDFTELGFPIIEIYLDRIEISNPGTPLISAERFIDEYVSRNESLADLMRRMGFCEEKGSGMDKVVFHNELYQLPAINVIVQERRTSVTLFAYKKLTSLGKKEKIQACYQHACLKYVSNDKMSNQSLRERFGIEDQNSSIASRIIRDTLDANKIKEDDPDSNSKKFKKYIPYWG